MTVVYLALGSNLGDRDRNLAEARRRLAAAGVRLLRQTPVRETEPFGVPDQPRFLNQVVEGEWDGTPRRLLETVKGVEREVGRRPSYRWGPREIDVDILLFGEEEVHEPDLRIPHPGLQDREFLRQLMGELGAETRGPREAPDPR